MSRRVIGYDSQRRAVWEDLGPAEYIEFGPLGGAAIEPRVTRSPDLPRPARVRDYHDSVTKGHRDAATARARTMIAAGRFFTANRLGRWLNRHGHRFIHPGKTGRYAMRTAEGDVSCFICRAVWAFIVSIPGFLDDVAEGKRDADAGRLYEWGPEPHRPADSWKADDPIQPKGWHHDGVTWVKDVAP